ncbi:MAG: alpha/beta hydrolase [Deltaproteobacteria bacterium]|nr:alpha/beta hydrolase [Deltaproteobacteria bacterium]
MTSGVARSKRRTWLRRTLIGVALAYLLLCATVFLAQGRLLFHPTTQTNADADALIARSDIDPLEIEVEGATLRGMIRRGQGQGPRPTVLYFGGNAEGVSRRLSDRDWVNALGWSFVVVPYRGYDRSSGSPSAEAYLGDVAPVFDAVAAHPDVDPEHIVAWGTSLGTGLAAHLADRRELAGVILAAPYARLSDIAAEQFPWLPVRALFRHEIDTLAVAPQITEAVLVLHGDADTLIGLEHGRRVADAWKGPAQLRVLAGAGHNDLARHAQMRPAVEAFLRQRQQ